MLDRKANKFSKDHHSQHEVKRINIETYERIRIFQKNLVFVSGLPPSLNDPQILRSSIYFGKYGQASKIIIKTVPGYKKQPTQQIYVTYQSELQASLAISALDGFTLDERPLKASYGTTKYCSHFLKGYECRNPDCFFLHHIDKKRQVSNEDTRNAFKEQSDEAFRVVCQNLQFVIEKFNEEKQRSQGFPSFKEMLDFLIESEYTSFAEIEGIKKKISQDNHRKSFNRQSGMKYKSESPKSKVKQQQKKTKSQSLWKLKTQQKVQNIESDEEKKKKQKQNINKTNEKPQKTVNKIPQTKEAELEKEVSLADTREFQLQQRIERMIIKKLFRTSSKPRSKMNFVKIEKAYTDELVKLRGIVQKYLINNN